MLVTSIFSFSHNVFKRILPQDQLSNTELRRNIFSIRVVDSWNSLTHEIVNAPSVNSFKNKLNSFWKHPSKFEPICYSQVATNSPTNENRWISSYIPTNDPGQQVHRVVKTLNCVVKSLITVIDSTLQIDQFSNHK